MDTEMTDPGPFDPSVLYDQDNHVSSAVWDGQERGVLRCHEHTSKLGEWRLTPKQIELVEKAGFGYLRRLPSISLDNPLISALVERWRKETNTFHLPVGEMTITLRDVALLLGLPVDGEPVLGVTYTSCKSICERFLGRAPEAGYMSGGMVKLSWLKEYFSQCSDDFSVEDIECHTRAYLLYLIGSTIFSTTTGNKVPVMYLPLFEDFQKAGRYAWGAAALAFLYRSLGNASLKSQSTISGGLTLLQCWSYFHLNIGRPKFFQEPLRDCFPLVFWWKGKQSAATVKRDIIFYRKALDSLEPCDVDWLPFKHINIALVPESIRNSLILGRSKTMLICFDKAERHLPDRCLRQYDMLQGIPVDVQQWERKTRGIDSGIHLLAKMESELNEWSARMLNIVEDDDDMEEGEYMYWYSRITRRLVGRPVTPLSQTQRTVKFRTKKKRMNTGLRDIANIADTFSIKGLDPQQAESISRIRAIAHACLGDEIETTVMVDASQLELGQRREKQRVRRSTYEKHRRKDDLMQYNAAAEEDEVLLYGSTVGADQIHLGDDIIGDDQSCEMMDRSYTKLGKRVRRREREKMKIGRKRRRTDNLMKCDAAIRDLESLIAKEDLQYSQNQNKEDQSHIVDEDYDMQPICVDVDCLQTYQTVVEANSLESKNARNETEIAEFSNDEGHKIENFHATGEVEAAEFSHAANEDRRNEYSHDNMEVERAADEVEKSVPTHTSDVVEEAEFSHAANEDQRNESSHDIMEVERAADEIEKYVPSHTGDYVESAEFSHAANEDQRNESSHDKNVPSHISDGVEGAERSHAADEVERNEAFHGIMEVDRGAVDIEKPGPTQTGCKVEGAELSHSANEVERNESSLTGSGAVERADTSLTSGEVKTTKASHDILDVERAEYSHAAANTQNCESSHADCENEKAEPSHATDEMEKIGPSDATDGKCNKPSHAACELKREIEKDASSESHYDKLQPFDESSEKTEKAGNSLRACLGNKRSWSVEAGKGDETGGGSLEVGEANKTSSLVSVKVDDTKLSSDTLEVGNLNQSAVCDEKTVEAENVGVEADPSLSPKTAKDSA